MFARCPGAKPRKADRDYLWRPRQARAFAARDRFWRGHAAPQRGDHRPCRPWQDHLGRPAAATVGRRSREPAPGGTRARLQRSRARARHHHPGQGDLDPLAQHPHQHRRYPGPCRFRRRGRAHPQHGGRRVGVGGRGRRPAAANQIRGVESAQGRAQAHRRDQQGRPA